MYGCVHVHIKVDLVSGYVQIYVIYRNPYEYEHIGLLVCFPLATS